MSKAPAKSNRQAPVRQDALQNDVSITAAITDSSLTIKGKSRALAAADRLLGGFIGIAAEWAEGIRARMEARNNGDVDVIRAESLARVREIEGLDDLQKFALADLLAERISKLENKAQVWAATQESLTLPPPDAAERPGPEVTGNDAGPERLDDDWLNMFASHAENASSERLRVLWGQILAGEIRKPGSFSPSTVRAIAEMDADIAKAFENVARLEVQGAVVRVEEGGLSDDHALLEEVGLIMLSGGMLSRRVMPSGQNPDGKVYIQGREYVLDCDVQPSVKELSYPVVALTRTGKQIASILGRDEERAMTEIAQAISPVQAVYLAKIVSRSPNGSVSFARLRKLK